MSEHAHTPTRLNWNGMRIRGNRKRRQKYDWTCSLCRSPASASAQPSQSPPQQQQTVINNNNNQPSNVASPNKNRAPAAQPTTTTEIVTAQQQNVLPWTMMVQPHYCFMMPPPPVPWRFCCIPYRAYCLREDRRGCPPHDKRCQNRRKNKANS